MRLSRGFHRTFGFALLASWAAAACLVSGCVERYLLVKSDPPGARIIVDLVEMEERTPARIPFEHYGSREVILRKAAGGDGAPEYESSREMVELRAPWYQWFPIDLIFDHILPWTITDEHELHVQLIPADEKVLRARLEEEAARQGLRPGNAEEKPGGEGQKPGGDNVPPANAPK